MIYLQGNEADPETWTISDIATFDYIRSFESRKQARSWILKELKRRSKEINKIRDRWLRDAVPV